MNDNTSIRVRICYEKRGGACFVPHVSLITLFARAALRAGLRLTMTEGFSPHPKISFGPELPVGVIALNELADVYLEPENKNNNWLDDCLARWNDAMPEGFNFIGATLPKQDSPSLGKLCQSALYWIRGLKLTSEELLALAQKFYGEDILDAQAAQDIEGTGKHEWLALTLASPAQNGIGGWVKDMIASGLISGWHELNIVRAAIGLWEFGEVVRP